VLATHGRAQPRRSRRGQRARARRELALRWSVFRAGFQSARDPRYTVIPQKQRKGHDR
jgi:hypothetical protein